MVVYATTDGGAAVGVYAPSVSTLPDGSTVDIDTSYPYEDEVRLTVNAKRPMPLYVRIPAWATHATLDGKAVANGTMVKKACVTGENKFILDFAPVLVVKRWGVSVSRCLQRERTFLVIMKGMLMVGASTSRQV